MSQQEFDTYLSLLCRLLRIAPQQREQVAEEFRTHMEDRLEDLLASGTEREEAVRLALEEFGDAAGLAAQIASISQGRRKRWIMRIGTVSMAGLAAAGLLAVALWPEGTQVKAPQVVAQTGEGRKGDEGGGGGAAPTSKKAASIEEKLAMRIDADFPEIPLRDVLDFLKENADLQIYVNRKAIDQVADGILETPITINLKQVRVDMVLDLILEQAEDSLAYVERDGILVISTTDALAGASEVKVYNCRDLLAMASPVPSAGLMGPGVGMPGITGMLGMPGAGMPRGLGSGSAPRTDSGVELPPGGFLPEDGALGGSTPKASSTPKGTPPAGGSLSTPKIPKGIQPQFGVGGGPPAAGAMPGGGGGMEAGGINRPQTEEEIRAERLMHLITTAVKPDSWEDMGGFGTISEYKGLIVINHNARTHKEVENVLKMLREAAGLPANGLVGGMMMPMPGPMPGGGPYPEAGTRR